MSPPQDLQGLTPGAVRALQHMARQSGYESPEAYLDALEVRDKNIQRTLMAARAQPLNPVQRTAYGTLYHCNALTYMQAQPEASHDLIITSPPFGLVRKKEYGNAASTHYCDWFRPFAQEMHRLLRESGSLVIDIGGSWVKGQPTRSLYHFDLLTMLVKEYGFHLCLEHFWYNPSKLPSPAEWVTIRRVRPKDAVNCVWWLSKSPYPKASNKRVVSPYSGRMEKLLEDGYEGRKRPSGHNISQGFSQRQQGAIPSNLLAIANTESNSAYSAYCRENDLPIHPARFPAKLPEYFIRMLTDPGDKVFDPFSGSFLTGRVCEELGRSWAGTELEWDYVQGGKSRFLPEAPDVVRPGITSYTLTAPCSFDDTDDIALPPDGGKKRQKKPAKTEKTTDNTINDIADQACTKEADNG
ncbi:DNA-methyltransferase [Vreelandella massiliensis]|uniref:DNA-methyltransferase n=1 Tax=Vreelandella massiliensis TaxID=1816686 RepID=UPI00096AA7EC|nr:site-specific DNA-methyltransferase [Halomonas massiliensis]